MDILIADPMLEKEEPLRVSLGDESEEAVELSAALSIVSKPNSRAKLVIEIAASLTASEFLLCAPEGSSTSPSSWSGGGR